MDFEGINVLVASFLVCLPAVQCGCSVTYSTTSVCGLKGTPVVLPCTYYYPWGHIYQRGEWYEEKSGRVRGHSNSRYPDCSLKIDKLADSGIYHFRFSTSLNFRWVTSKPGITVTVTDVEVKEVDSGNQNQTKVNCITSCSLGSQYVWYKHVQLLQDQTPSILVSEVASYSCAVKGYEDLRSPAVCVPYKQCWGVTYAYNNVCALTGTSADIPCTFLHPKDQKINTTFWFNKQKSNTPMKDLLLGQDYEKHVEYLGNKENNCTLRLKDIRESHSGEYGFRFTTEQGESYSGLPGVNITVTALQVLAPVEGVKEGNKVTLTCSTTCTMRTNPTFIWYKNRQPNRHTTTDKLHLNPVCSEDTGNYSCTVKGHENFTSTAFFLNVRYKPRHVSVSISPDEIEEGRSVTLTCTSDANPPAHTYTWYMERSGAESLVRGTVESIRFNVTSDTSGLYYCEAQSELGSQKSVGVSVPPKGSEAFAVILPAIAATFIVLIVLLLLGIVCLRKKKAETAADTATINADKQGDLLYSNTVTPRAMTSDPTERVGPSSNHDDIQYATITKNHSKAQEGPPYSTVEKHQTSAQNDDIAYTSVQFLKGSAATRVHDASVIYSTVHKP